MGTSRLPVVKSGPWRFPPTGDGRVMDFIRKKVPAELVALSGQGNVVQRIAHSLLFDVSFGKF